MTPSTLGSRKHLGWHAGPNGAIHRVEHVVGPVIVHLKRDENTWAARVLPDEAVQGSVRNEVGDEENVRTVNHVSVAGEAAPAAVDAAQINAEGRPEMAEQPLLVVAGIGGPPNGKDPEGGGRGASAVCCWLVAIVPSPPRLTPILGGLEVPYVASVIVSDVWEGRKGRGQNETGNKGEEGGGDTSELAGAQAGKSTKGEDVTLPAR